MIKALISVGTNSTRALVADIHDGSGYPLAQRSIGTRIGEGLKERGHIGEQPMRRTLEAIHEHLELIKPYTSHIGVIATSAVRRADNADEFARKVRGLTGAQLQIISGEDEARCSYAGALSGLPNGAHERFAVADVGGGSTEYAAGSKRSSPDREISCEIGAVRLTELITGLCGRDGAVLQDSLERGRRLALAATEPIATFEPVDQLLFVGGTATTTISLLQGNREPFTYSQLSGDDVEGTLQMLCSIDLVRRKTLPGMNPQRADILPAGLIVLAAVMERAGHDRAVVSTNDVLLGFLLRS